MAEGMQANWREKGEVLNLNYAGDIVILTRDKYKRLTDELARLKNELDVSERKTSELELELAKSQNSVKDLKAKSERASKSLNELPDVADAYSISALFGSFAGQGRPSVLTDEHKELIESFYQQGRPVIPDDNGKTVVLETAKDWEKLLVYKMGYKGSYEPVRAFVAEMKQKYPRKF